MKIPAFCDKCGVMFVVPNAETGPGSVAFVNCTGGACPACGGQGRIPDITIVGDVIKTCLVHRLMNCLV